MLHFRDRGVPSWSGRVRRGVEGKTQPGEILGTEACHSNTGRVFIHAGQMFFSDEVLSENGNSIGIVLCWLERQGVDSPIPQIFIVITDAIWHGPQEDFVGKYWSCFVIPGPTTN